MNAENRNRYEVVNIRTGERFGNHTYGEAVSRAQVMRRNWNYREKFEAREALPSAERNADGKIEGDQ